METLNNLNNGQFFYKKDIENTELYKYIKSYKYKKYNYNVYKYYSIIINYLKCIS